MATKGDPSSKIIVLGWIFKIAKEQISYVPLEPVADYVHILDLNTGSCVGWKTLPNLNFELKFQTQISNLNLNFKR